jgi:hypothetical protein
MTHILANFGGIDAGAQVQQQGANALRQHGDETQTGFVNSCDYWDGVVNEAQVATGHQWWTKNDALATDADRLGNGMVRSSQDYQTCSSQSLALIERAL